MLSLLFIGNSYIGQNKLPAQTEALLKAMQRDEVRVESLLRTGGKLWQVEEQTSKDSPWRDTLVKETWSWVILQEQSQIPGFGAGNDAWDKSLRAVKKLDARIATSGATTAFMNTWGYRDGDEQNREVYPDFTSMQSRLEDGYSVYATAITTGIREPLTIPVGQAFERIHLDMLSAGRDPLEPSGPFYALYHHDGGHPSPAGTYLAACVIAASLTGEPVQVDALGPDMGPVMTSYLQDVATRVVLKTPPKVDVPLTPDPEPDPIQEARAETEEKAEEEASSGCSGWFFGAALMWLPVGLRRFS